jgi:hypothetical protein
VATTSSANAWAVGYYLNHQSGASTLIARWNGTAWKQVPSPNPGGPTGSNYLFAVAATSVTNAWAVGSGNLIEHWNGTAWTQVPSHNPSPGGFAAVTATSASNAWAAGAVGSPPDTLIEHWTGTRWAQVPSPSPGKDLNRLDGVAATSATNAWAVGYYSQHSAPGTQMNTRTLIEHWNGTAWKQVPSPNPVAGSNDDFLTAVAATSATNAWAVGDYTQGKSAQTLILYWNGTAWTQVPSPNPSSMVNRLSAVSALSSSNAWAVGDYYQSNKVTYKTLILHWNGTAWTPAYSPSPGIDGNALSGVSAVSGSNAWAVGDYVNRINGVEVAKTLILHWNGTAWRETASPNPSSRSNVLLGVSADLASDAWAVGDYVYVNVNNRFVNRTLILHWNGTAWVRT